jgi:hypothetical protein
MTASSAAGTTWETTRPTGETSPEQGTKIVTRPAVLGEEILGWAARVFLVLSEDDRIREDYHLTVTPLAPR